MNINELKDMSIDTLQELVSNAQRLLNKYEEDKKKKVIKEIQELAASADLSIEIKSEKPPKLKAKGVVKYRNTSDPKQTWTGRGKRPKWLTDQLEQGKTLEDFAI